MKVYQMSPSSAFVNVELGEIILFRGKHYILVNRGPWVAEFYRWYWFDPYLVAVADWIDEKLRNVRERYGSNKAGNGIESEHDKS